MANGTCGPVLLLIPARSGSKGLPRKNLLTVAGISLVGQAARIACQVQRNMKCDSRVLIDTDSVEIAAEAERFGATAPFLRPPEMSADATRMADNVLHAADRLAALGERYETVVLLQPTSPLRAVGDVLACLRAYRAGCDSVVGVCAADHPPEQAIRFEAGTALRWAFSDRGSDARRQDLSSTYRMSGSVYVTGLDTLRAHQAFIIPGRTQGVALPSERCIDVDSATDLALAETLAAERLVAEVAIGRNFIGVGQPCYVIAEAGVNHNGRLDLAHRLVDMAADAGAHAIKFQTFDPAKLVACEADMAEYQIANTGTRRKQAEMLRELVLSKDAHASLMQRARDRGIDFLSSPFDEDSADFLAELGVPAFKLGSGELTNHPLLAHIAKKSRPMLISTGMADMAEVGAALDAVAEAGDPPIALLHCVTSYPAAAADLNLRVIANLQRAFGVPAGLSDHTDGTASAVAATALGACVIEKHLTLDRALPGPDHKASLEPHELTAMVRAIRDTQAALGDGVKTPRPVELPLRTAARKSLHAARDLPAGAVLATTDMIALRPGHGIAPSCLNQVAGRRLRVGVPSGKLIEEADLD